MPVSIEPISLRLEFARLFGKFHIGQMHYTFRDAQGRPVKVAVRSCGDCHVETKPAKYLAAATQGLTSMIARAEGIQLAAHRGGVEAREARAHLNSPVDNQIELETIVHTFNDPDLKKKSGRRGFGTHASL